LGTIFFKSDGSQLGLETGPSITLPPECETSVIDEVVDEAGTDCVGDAGAGVAVGLPPSQGTVTVTVVAALRGTAAPAAAVARAHNNIVAVFISKNESEGTRGCNFQSRN
jgi:hypothetical protein